MEEKSLAFSSPHLGNSKQQSYNKCPRCDLCKMTLRINTANPSYFLMQMLPEITSKKILHIKIPF